MAQSFRVTINSKVLIWARKSTGLEVDQAARKIGVKPELLKKWESAEAKPTINQLRSAASVYKRPVATFYLPTIPYDGKEIHDFRVLPAQSKLAKTPELAFEIRRAMVRRDLALTLLEYLGEEIMHFDRTAKISDDVEHLADEIRVFLGVTIAEQYKWKNEYEALRRWKVAMEGVGVLVFQASRIPLSVMRGFSISEQPLPVIVVNSADAARGKIFTLLHELGHLILSNGGVCDLRELKGTSRENQKTEIFCNYLAGSILVPNKEFMLQSPVPDKRIGEEWSEDELRLLADKFKVSKQVILRRLLITGRISSDFYRRKYEEYEELALHLPARRGEGGPSMAVKSVANNGTRFTRLVLSAYYADVITAADVSNYLGVKLGHLSEIEQNVRY